MTKNNTIELNSDLEKFFLDECHNVASKQGLQVSSQLNHYLASMLSRFMLSTNFFERETDPYSQKSQNSIPTVGVKLLKANQKGAFEQFIEMQQVGDIALFTAGFFGENIERRHLDMDFYTAIGGQAYQRAGQIRETLSRERALNVYFELSGKFSDISELLSELSDRRLLNSPKDTLMLYEKWVATENPRIRRMLGEAGILTAPTKNVG